MFNFEMKASIPRNWSFYIGVVTFVVSIMNLSVGSYTVGLIAGCSGIINMYIGYRISKMNEENKD